MAVDVTETLAGALVARLPEAAPVVSALLEQTLGPRGIATVARSRVAMDAAMAWDATAGVAQAVMRFGPFIARAHADRTGAHVTVRPMPLSMARASLRALCRKLWQATPTSRAWLRDAAGLPC